MSEASWSEDRKAVEFQLEQLNSNMEVLSMNVRKLEIAIVKMETKMSFGAAITGFVAGLIGPAILIVKQIFTVKGGN